MNCSVVWILLQLEGWSTIFQGSCHLKRWAWLNYLAYHALFPVQSCEALHDVSRVLKQTWLEFFVNNLLGKYQKAAVLKAFRYFFLSMCICINICSVDIWHLTIVNFLESKNWSVGRSKLIFWGYEKSIDLQINLQISILKTTYKLLW